MASGETNKQTHIHTHTHKALKRSNYYTENIIKYDDKKILFFSTTYFLINMQTVLSFMKHFFNGLYVYVKFHIVTQYFK